MADDLNGSLLPKGWTTEVLKNHYRYKGHLVASYPLSADTIELITIDGDELHEIQAKGLREALKKMQRLLDS